jgi:hypothetical protein
MVFTPGLKETNELVNYLRDKLHIPENVQTFEIRFSIDNPIVVCCEYYPENTDGN